MTTTRLMYAEDLYPHIWVQGPPRKPPTPPAPYQGAYMFLATTEPPPAPEPCILWVQEVRTYGNVVSLILIDPLDGEQVSMIANAWQHLNVVEDPDLPLDPELLLNGDGG